MQASEHDECTSTTIVVRKAIRAGGGRDVDLDDDEIWRIVQVEGLDMLVLELRFILSVQVRGERREAEGREQRVFDRPPQRAGRLGQSWKNQFDLHRSPSPTSSTETSRARGPSSSTRKTRCHRPSCSRPPATFRHTEQPSNRARQCECPFGRSPSTQLTLRSVTLSCRYTASWGASRSSSPARSPSSSGSCSLTMTAVVV